MKNPILLYRLPVLTCFVIATLFFSCRKNSGSREHVYVAGTEITGGNMIAKLWKDGKAKALSEAKQTVAATSVVVSGHDEYVSGYEVSDYGFLVAKLWKNGVPQNLSDGNEDTKATDVFVSGGDVYVCGWQFDGFREKANVWKNGAAIPAFHWSDMELFSIYVVGTDCYAAGMMEDINHKFIAVVLKNGQLTKLTNGSQNAAATDIWVDNGTVYVVGYNGNLAMLWKNGTPTPLTDGSHVAYANAIAVSNGDVYVAGLENNGTLIEAKYWENGTPVVLSEAGKRGSANGIYVFENDLYISGTQEKQAILWKNGIPTTLSDGTNDVSVRSVFVK